MCFAPRRDQLHVLRLSVSRRSDSSSDRARKTGRDETETRVRRGENMIRSPSEGVSHFCSVICLNPGKHLSTREEARPQGTTAAFYKKKKG